MKSEFTPHAQTAGAVWPHPRLGRLMQALGIILCLGGFGHSAGVVRFYVGQGIPDLNRVH